MNEAAWPRSIDSAIKERLTAAEFPAPGAWGYCEPVDVHIYRDSIQTQERHAMDLLIFKEGSALDVVLARQAVEVRTADVEHLSDKHDRIVIGELVRAILQDEPMKMRRLADIFTLTSPQSTRCGSSAAIRQEDREKLADVLEPVLRDTRACSEGRHRRHLRGAKWSCL